MRTFVALFEEPTSEDGLKFINFLKLRDFGYWHWTTGAWIITASDLHENIAQTLRDVIKSTCKAHIVLVLEIDSVLNWSGFGPSSSDNDMFTWIREQLGGQKAPRVEQFSLDLDK